MSVTPETEVRPTARTSLQLYNNLARRGLAPDDQAAIREAYDSATSLFGYYYFENGTPLVAHVVGTASLLASSGAPAKLIAASLVYPALMVDAFADTDRNETIATKRRRRMLQNRLGTDTESLVYAAYRMSAGDAHLNGSPAATILDAARKDLSSIHAASRMTIPSDSSLAVLTENALPSVDSDDDSNRSVFNRWSRLQLRSIPPNSVRPTGAAYFRRRLARTLPPRAGAESGGADKGRDTSTVGDEFESHPSDQEALAQSVSQLMHQLEAAGSSEDDLDKVRTAYLLAIKLFSGRIQGSGRQFLAHVIGCASILAQLDAPIDHICAALLHNVYRNGDFGTALPLASPERRQKMSAIVGASCENYLYEFLLFTRKLQFDSATDGAETMSVFERGAVLIYLVDQLEKMIDLEILYVHDASEQVRIMGSRMEVYCNAATALGYPALSTRLRAAWARAVGASVPSGFVAGPNVDPNPVPTGFSTRWGVTARHRVYQPLVRRLRRVLRRVPK